MASLAPVVLVALAVLSPWAMGAVSPLARAIVTTLALAASALVLLAGARRGSLELPAVPLWPLAGFLGLAALQLVPLPVALHRLIAPGSASVWHPDDPLVASVLGPRARPLSLDPGTTLQALALTGGLALLALLSAPVLSRPRAAGRGALAVALFGFALAAYAIFARARFGALLYGYLAVETVAPFGPFVSKNHFAGWSAMAALLAAGLGLGLADEARARRRDWTTDTRAGVAILALVAALGMALAALVSLSRGGAMALAAGAASLLALRLASARGARGALVSTLLPALVMGALLVGLVPQEAHERMRSLSGASFRLDTWRDTLRLAAASPLLGQGLGAFHDAYPRYKHGYGILRVEHAENDYLETLAETGLLGLCLALCGLALLVAAAWQGRRATGGSLVRGIAQGGTAALAALAVHSSVDFNLRIPSNAALAALVVAAVAAQAGPRARPLPRPAAAAVALVALALAAASLMLPQRPWLAGRQELQAAGAARSPAVRLLRLERAEAALTSGLAWRPAQAESWLMLAAAHQALARPASAAAFARHALRLDPERAGLREAVERIAGASP